MDTHENICVLHYDASVALSRRPAHSEQPPRYVFRVVWSLLAFVAESMGRERTAFFHRDRRLRQRSSFMRLRRALCFLRVPTRAEHFAVLKRGYRATETVSGDPRKDCGGSG